MNSQNDRDLSNRIFVLISSQVSLTVHGSGVFRELQERVMKWAFDQKRNLRGIPETAWKGESFEVNAENSEYAAAVKLDTPKYWAFKLRERLKDHNRIWTTEVGIAETDANQAVLGCRLLCAQKGTQDKIPRSIPSFVRKISYTQEAMLDGRRIGPDPWFVNSRQDVQELVSFILDKARQHPIVVFSLPEGSDNPGETIISVNDYYRRTVGFVHAVIITSDASFLLTDHLGKEFAVFRQAIRTFNPGFDLAEDLWSDHPLASSDRIKGWSENQDDTFVDFLVQQSLRLTRPRDELEQKHPPFQRILQLSAEQARSKAQSEGKDDKALLELALQEKDASKKEAEESLDLAISAEEEKNQVLNEIRQIKASYHSLQVRLEALQKAQSAANSDELVIPKSLTEIREWAQTHLSGDVEMHERAIKSASNSDFQDASLVYQSLLILRDFYVPMRRSGGAEKLEAFRQRLAEFGLEETQCFAQKNKARNFGGSYFVDYQGEKRELDRHLKGGTSREERFGFRLYFFWDAETSRVVVGHLPGHLRTDQS